MKKMLLMTALLAVTAFQTVTAQTIGKVTHRKDEVAQKLRKCDFLFFNHKYKHDAKVYLCLFSASWCGPCRREMPRISKIYSEMLRFDKDIELIHFSRDKNEYKAREWVKELDARFPVVKPESDNPLGLKTSGIPHLFILKADGTLLEEGHPASLFTEEKIRALKETWGSNNKIALRPKHTKKKVAKERPILVQAQAKKENLFILPGPYGIRVEAEPGCEKGAVYVLNQLRDVYLPHAVKFYGDPFDGKRASRVFTIRVKRNDGSDRDYTGPSWGSCSDGIDCVTVGLAKGSDEWRMDLPYLASRVLTICDEDDDARFYFYVKYLIEGQVECYDPTPRIMEVIQKGLGKDDNEWCRKMAPMWVLLEKLRVSHPSFVRDYCRLKNDLFLNGELSQRPSMEEMAVLLSEVTQEDVPALFKKCVIK